MGICSHSGEATREKEREVKKKEQGEGVVCALSAGNQSRDSDSQPNQTRNFSTAKMCHYFNQLINKIPQK